MTWRVFGAALVAAVALTGAPTPAWAVPPQTPRAEVLAALGIERRPADYVVVVDVSRSMLAEGRYDRVRAALTDMMGVLQPSDHVSLITFSEEARVVHRGTDKQAALAALPATPAGRHTDIGAGIAAGLAELQRADAQDSAVLALVTDGTLDAAPGSEYASPDAPGWARLATDAAALTAQRPVAAYAIALGPETDAGLLGTVLPHAGLVPGEQIGPHLGRLDAELLDFRAAEALRGDSRAAVTANWEGLDPGALVRSGTGRATLTITSGMAHTPLEVGGLDIRGIGVDASATGLPPAIPLAPGEARRFAVELDLGDLDPAGGELAVAGTVSSPWQDAMGELALEFSPDWAGSTVLLATASGPAGETGTTRLGTALAASTGAALVLLALLGPAILRSRAAGRTGGTLLVQRDDEPLDEILLAGSAVTLGPALSHLTPGISGRVLPARAGRDDGVGVRVVARLGARRVRTTLRDGESVRLGGLELRFVAPGTRALQMAVRDLTASVANGPRPKLGA